MIRILSAVLLGLALSPLVLPALVLPAHAADCGDAIAHFRGLIDRDVKTGMLDRSVYDVATQELVKPEQNCRDGRSSAAIAELDAIKRRHGYH